MRPTARELEVKILPPRDYTYQLVLESSKFKTRCLRFIGNLIDTNKICYPIKFDIPYSTEMLKFSSEVFSLKVGFTPKLLFFLHKSMWGLGNCSGASGSALRLILDQTRHIRAKCIDKILIRA